jgi:hypothetical protein
MVFFYFVTFSGRTGRLVNAHPEPGDVKAFVAVVVNTSNLCVFIYHSYGSTEAVPQRQGNTDVRRTTIYKCLA